MTLKAKLFLKLFDWLDRNQPEQMQKRIKDHVDRIVPEVARQTVMAYLDQQRLLHCGACATRHGLHRVLIQGRETYLCDKHYSQWQSQQMAEATQK